MSKMTESNPSSKSIVACGMGGDMIERDWACLAWEELQADITADPYHENDPTNPLWEHNKDERVFFRHRNNDRSVSPLELFDTIDPEGALDPPVDFYIAPPPPRRGGKESPAKDMRSSPSVSSNDDEINPVGDAQRESMSSSSDDEPSPTGTRNHSDNNVTYVPNPIRSGPASNTRIRNSQQGADPQRSGDHGQPASTGKTSSRRAPKKGQGQAPPGATTPRTAIAQDPRVHDHGNHSSSTNQETDYVRPSRLLQGPNPDLYPKSHIEQEPNTVWHHRGGNKWARGVPQKGMRSIKTNIRIPKALSVQIQAIDPSAITGFQDQYDTTGAARLTDAMFAILEAGVPGSQPQNNQQPHGQGLPALPQGNQQ